MSVVTIREITGGEPEARMRLQRAHAWLRDFKAKSNPQTRTKELWAKYYQIQAEAVWCEDALERMKREREKRDKKRKAAEEKRRWER